MLVLDMSVGNKNEGELIENPNCSQIEAAIHELNDKTKTLVTLGADDETYMSLGGGESEKYIVTVTFDNLSFYSLVDSSKPNTIEKLVVGGQEGIYPAKMCVDLLRCLLAARTFQQVSTSSSNNSSVQKLGDRLRRLQA